MCGRRACAHWRYARAARGRHGEQGGALRPAPHGGGRSGPATPRQAAEALGVVCFSRARQFSRAAYVAIKA